jgi:hypothetical protein
MAVKEVRVYEDFGGCIHCVIFSQGTVKNIISGVERGELTGEAFIQAAQAYFPDAEPYCPGMFCGMDMEDAYREIQQESAEIANIRSDNLILYGDDMGENGKILFDLDF